MSISSTKSIICYWKVVKSHNIPCKRCKSLPQIVLPVTLSMTSPSSMIFGRVVSTVSNSISKKGDALWHWQKWWIEWLTNFNRIFSLPGQGFHSMAWVAISVSLIVADICGDRAWHGVCSPRTLGHFDVVDVITKFLVINWLSSWHLQIHRKGDEYICLLRQPGVLDFWHHSYVASPHCTIMPISRWYKNRPRKQRDRVWLILTSWMSVTMKCFLWDVLFLRDCLDWLNLKVFYMITDW